MDAEPRLFRGTPARCDDCHGDAHLGAFEVHHEELAATEEGSCARCHDATRFADVKSGAFDHGYWTGFPLGGAHAQEACETCHTPRGERDALGRSFGRVIEAFEGLEPDRDRHCADCHQDPHLGAFSEPGLPAKMDARSGCARCHGEDSFRVLPHGFDHELWTGFPLDGAHATVSCASCHAPKRRPDVNGRTWTEALGSDCQDCHIDPHGAQFERRGTTRCIRCHTSSETFEISTFDHSRTKFPLHEAHQTLKCADCHKTETVETKSGAAELVRYAPLDRDCVDCHGEQKGKALRRRSRKR